MLGFINKNIWLIVLLLFVVLFFKETILQGLLPIPADTIVGLYHPYLDYYSKVSPSGVPFQNFLITDPVRQIIPWKLLVIDNLSRLQLPLWNPYEMSGSPLLANFQSSVFYPLNILLFVKPFYASWTVFIFLQPLLAAIFTFLYLRNIRLDPKACLLGASTFALGGFSLVWLEWGNIVHTVLWLPLILLSIDKITSEKKQKILSIWNLMLLVSLVLSFFAGHLQSFFYLFILSFAYFILRFFEHGKKIKLLISYAIINSILFILTAIQWYPTLQFINLSARSVDQNPLTSEGWFVPVQHLVQFLIPDFFGNPATLNYWGVWNYSEFTGYIGVLALFLALCAIFAKNRKTIIFFISAIIVSLVFALHTPIAQLPYSLSIPFLSSAQPTRLMFVITFSLSILAAFGFDYLLKEKVNKKALIVLVVFFSGFFLGVWLIASGVIDLNISPENLIVAKRNLLFPGGIAALGIFSILGFLFIREELTKSFFVLAIITLCLFDLFRFGSKFTPFTTSGYFFPTTSAIEYLKKDDSVFRVASADSSTFPPNFATYYKIQSIDGYDPLYIKRYAEFIAASARGKPDITPPLGFNRIITFQNLDSRMMDFLGVKYVLTLSDVENQKYKKVYSEGNMRVYQNQNVFNRAFFVSEVFTFDNNQKALESMFSEGSALDRMAVVENAGDTTPFNKGFDVGAAEIVEYSENKVKIKTTNAGDGFLVLVDTYYPTWRVKIDGIEDKIYLTDYTFRGVLVPRGEHIVEFYNTL